MQSLSLAFFLTMLTPLAVADVPARFGSSKFGTATFGTTIESVPTTPPVSLITLTALIGLLAVANLKWRSH